MPFTPVKTQGTRTTAGAQFQCLGRGLDAVDPVSSEISSGSILMIPLYFFNNIYPFLTWGTAALISRDEDWRLMPIRCSWGQLPTNYWSVFATEDLQYHFLFGKTTLAFIISIYTSISHFREIWGSISDGLAVILDQVQNVSGLKALFQFGIATHC